MSESYIQREIVKRLKRLGFLAHKVEQKNWPDFVFFNKITFFIEFKRSVTEKPNLGQLNMHKQLRDKGFDVFVIGSTKQWNFIQGYLDLNYIDIKKNG